MCVLRFVLYFNKHIDLKYTGCLDFSPYGCYRRSVLICHLSVSISIYIHVNFTE